MKLESISIIAWLIDNAIKTENGTQVDLKNNLYLYDIYRDMSPKQVGLKGAQVKYSTTMILKSFWIAKNLGMNQIYTLPTYDDVRQFAGGKINRLIAQNPILQEWTHDKDTIDQKQVGDSMIYYRGTWLEKAAMMVSSDLNIYDEVDSSKQQVVEQYATRLQASPHKWEWYFSHPSVPGNGVSKYWPLSDQKHWFVKCKCGKEQYLSWPESIDMEREIFQCKYCHQEITDEQRRVGRWVQKYKDREWSGYWIPLLIVPSVSAKDIIGYYKEKSPEYFTNKVLGLPYVGSGNKLIWDSLRQNITSEFHPQDGRIVIGVDTGTTIWYTLGDHRGFFHYGKASNYDDIEGFLRRWPRSIAVFDQGGDLIKPRELQEKYPGRIFLCHYSVDRKTKEMIRWGEKDEFGNVVVDRNRMIQLLVDEFTDQRIPLYGTESEWYDYWLHWNNIYRVEEENALGVPVRKWERSGPDHLVHSSVYCRVGLSRFAQDGHIVGEGVKKKPNSYIIDPDNTVSLDMRRFLQDTKQDKYDWRE